MVDLFRLISPPAEVRPVKKQEEIQRIDYAQPRAVYEKTNVRFLHDPLWRGRFWSIQSARDSMTGEDSGGHLAWTPLYWLFVFGQVNFLTLPILGLSYRYGYGISLMGYIAVAIGVEILLLTFQSICRKKAQ